MKILGHGVDLIHLPSFQQLLENSESEFTSRSFTDEEISEFTAGPKRIEKIAGHFAAKEAVLKALGTGFGIGVAFTDICIRREAGKPPEVTLTGGAAKIAEQLGINDWQLSISHSEEMAMASVIAISDASI